jgi:hypothetical protein
MTLTVFAPAVAIDAALKTTVRLLELAVVGVNEVAPTRTVAAGSKLPAMTTLIATFAGAVFGVKDVIVGEGAERIAVVASVESFSNRYPRTIVEDAHAAVKAVWAAVLSAPT